MEGGVDATLIVYPEQVFSSKCECSKNCRENDVMTSCLLQLFLTTGGRCYKEAQEAHKTSWTFPFIFL